MKRARLFGSLLIFPVLAVLLAGCQSTQGKTTHLSPTPTPTIEVITAPTPTPSPTIDQATLPVLAASYSGNITGSSGGEIAMYLEDIVQSGDSFTAAISIPDLLDGNYTIPGNVLSSGSVVFTLRTPTIYIPFVGSLQPDGSLKGTCSVTASGDGSNLPWTLSPDQ